MGFKKKKCIICGEEIEPTNGRQNTCNNGECNKENERIQNKKYQREYRKKDKIKGLIRASTKYHYRNKKEKCEVCGTTENLEFHHPEPYNDKIFEVLCKKHHLEEHNKQKEIKMENIFS